MEHTCKFSAVNGRCRCGTRAPNRGFDNAVTVARLSQAERLALIEARAVAAREAEAQAEAAQARAREAEERAEEARLRKRAKREAVEARKRARLNKKIRATGPARMLRKKDGTYVRGGAHDRQSPEISEGLRASLHDRQSDAARPEDMTGRSRIRGREDVRGPAGICVEWRNGEWS